MFISAFFSALLITGLVKAEHGHGEGEDMIFTEQQLRALKTRSVSILFPSWTNGIVPYVMDSSFSNSSWHVDALQNSINVLQNKTCLRIVPRTTESNYITFFNTGPNGGCSSNVGMVGGNQNIRIADWCTGKPTGNLRSSWYSTVHEIIHALGFVHEQCRPDRNSYVKVYTDNPAANNVNYQTIPVSQSLIVSQYDYTSLMHYPGQIGLLETLDSQYQSVIGQRTYMSDCDVAKINRYYQCSSNYQQTACPVNGPPVTTQQPTTTTTEYYYNGY